MWLIHQTHDHISLRLILSRQLPPESGEVTRRGSPGGSNHLAIPSRVIMNINNTMGARLQARLHQCVILAKIGCVKGATEDIVDEVLPGNGKAENVETVIFGKMRHLAGTVVTAILEERRVNGGEGAGTLEKGSA